MLLGCGGHSVVYVTDPPDGSAAGADGSSASKKGGTAIVQNADEPTDFKYAYSILATTPNHVVLMLFLTDRPRTCSDHLAGVDYLGAKDVYYYLRWYPKDAGPVTGTWYFSKDWDGKERDPKVPTIESWFFEHTQCGESGKVRGRASGSNDVNYLTLSEAGSARVSGTFVTQVVVDGDGSSGRRALYLHGSFDTVPCVIPDLFPPDPGTQYATLPSKTCL